MNKIITDTIKKYNMLSPGDTVLAAVSGGADSMLLLDYLIKNAKKLDISVIAAHIEHGIRGDESLEDAAFVSRFCKEHGVPLSTLSIDAVKGAKAEHMGVEEYSRKKRYEFFYSIECDKIASAHNLSDNIETVIFRMARGSGLKGVCGIPPVRGRIIRPLIEIPAQRVREYCLSENIPYRVDSTNLLDEYSRNKIRNRLLPVLSKVNPGYEKSFLNFIGDINEDSDFIENAALSAFEAAHSAGRLLKSVLIGLEPAILKRVIIKYFSVNNITPDRFHINETAQLAFKNSRVQISGNIFAVSDNYSIRIAHFGRADSEFRFVPEILNINEFNCNNVDFYCDCDTIIGSIVVRKRKGGDFIRPSGRNCTKSLKKLFNEQKLPAEERDGIAVIADGGGVIGVANVCADERVAVSSQTKNVFTIRFIPED